uniref:Uncharacterized protein n=1 Tax=viral metagenome TaxID=1070528 RepID=A0A6C0HH59_9ZZZZ
MANIQTLEEAKKAYELKCSINPNTISCQEIKKRIKSLEKQPKKRSMYDTNYNKTIYDPQLYNEHKYGPRSIYEYHVRKGENPGENPYVSTGEDSDEDNYVSTGEDSDEDPDYTPRNAEYGYNSTVKPDTQPPTNSYLAKFTNIFRGKKNSKTQGGKKSKKQQSKKSKKQQGGKKSKKQQSKKQKKTHKKHHK